MPATAKPEAPFDIVDTYIHLEDGPAAVPLEVGDDFWETMDRRDDLDGGRLVCAFHFSEDWSTWEVHPAGDEIVYLLSGAVDLVLEEEEDHRVVELRDRAACVVPRGVWHTARVHRPSVALHITRGSGTRVRPVES